MRLAEHPNIQVQIQKTYARALGPYEVGFLGILNGLFGASLDTSSPIIAYGNFDGDGNMISVERFEVSRG